MGLPPALNEHPTICNAYIRAFFLADFNGLPHKDVQEVLELHRTSLMDSLKGTDPALDSESPAKLRELGKMVTTLRSVEKRLRVNPDSYIVYYEICPSCWTHHPLSELPRMDDVVKGKEQSRRERFGMSRASVADE